MGVPTPLPSLVGSSSLLALPFSLFASLSLGSRGDGTGQGSICVTGNLPTNSLWAATRI